MTQVLRQLPKIRDPNVLVGAATADDAGVYRISKSRAIVQTVDFFTPIVDDPFVYGQIAAANALSDIYAMGGRPLTALNLLAIPTDLVPPNIVGAILKGGVAKIREARCVVLGGHTIQNPEPVYGLSVLGMVSPRRMITNAAAEPTDVLVLTKPLGTGIATTGVKRNLASGALAKKAGLLMSRLNAVGAELGEQGLVRAATDITGFGLLGHLGSMCRASNTGAEVFSDRVPVIGKEIFRLIEQDCVPGGSRENLNTANGFVEWDGVDDAEKAVLTDAQTSGGLLLCVRQDRLKAVLEILKQFRTPCAAVIGRIVRSKKSIIRVIR